MYAVFFTIILLCVDAAILYGIFHDQVTARLCVEYFTIGHPNIFGTDNPTVLAIAWGICTWWVGFYLACHCPCRPPWEPS